MGVKERYLERQRQKNFGVKERYEAKKYYDEDIASFVDDAKRLFSTEDKENTYAQWQELDKKAYEIDSWLSKNKNYIDENAASQLSNMLKDFRSGTEGYANAKNEEDFKQAYFTAKDYNEKLNTDLGVLLSEIDDLQKKHEELVSLRGKYNQRKSKLSRSHETNVDDDPILTELREQIEAYGDVESTLNEKKNYYTLAKRVQEAHKLSSVSDETSELYDPEFEKYATQGMEMDSNKVAIVRNSPAKMQNRESIASMVESDWITGFNLVNEHVANAILNDKNYKAAKYMKENEFMLYSYYLAKDEANGTSLADKYYDSIEETLNFRQAEETAKDIDGFWETASFAVESGLDQFGSGIKGLGKAIIGNEEYTPASSTQMTSQMVREKLGTVGKVAYDVTTTTANMLPSILTSVAVDAVAPGAGSAIGGALLGASAGGSAYTQMINLGYDKNQARLYAVLVGGSEAVLQYALGGISKLGGGGGGIFKSLGAKALTKIDHTLARVAITLGANALDEGLEEGLQSMLEPWFAEIATGVDWDDPSVDEVLYSSLLGVLSSVLLEGGDTIRTERRYKKAGDIIINNGGVETLKKFGLTFDENTDAYKLANKVGENTGASVIGSLYAAIETEITKQNSIDVQKALVEKGLSKKDAKRVSEYLLGDMQNLTDKQKKEIEDTEGIKAVVDELIENPRSAINERKNNLFMARLGTKIKAERSGDLALNNDVDVTEKVSKTGKTTIEKTDENGKAVVTEANIDKRKPIAKVKYVKGERVVYLNTDHGVVESSKVKYANKDEALLYESFADMNAAFANAVIRNYDGKVPLDAYIRGMREGMILYGMHNFKDIPKSSFLAELSAEDQAFALKLGRAYAKADAKKANTDLHIAIKKAAEKAKANESTTTHEGTQNKAKKERVRFEEGAKEETHKQHKKIISLAKHLASAIGIDIVFYDSSKTGKKAGENANGYYDFKTDTIYLDLQNAKNDAKTIAFTLSHELVHFIKKWSPNKYAAFAEFLIDQYAAHGISSANLLKQKMVELKTTDVEFAYEEMIADACETMLLDSNATVKLMELRKSDLELFEKIKLHVLKILNNIREAYKSLGYKPTSADANALLGMKDVIEKFYSMFEEAAVDATQNYQALGTEGYNEFVAKSTENAIKYQAKMKDGNGNSYWQIESEKDILKDLKDVNALQKAAYQYILRGDKGDKVIGLVDGHNLEFIRISAKEYVYGTDSKKLTEEQYKQKMRMSTSVIDLIENASISYDAPDHKNHKFFPNGFKNYQGRVGIDETIFRYIVRVGKAKNGMIFYDIFLEVDGKVPRANRTSLIKSSTSTNKISQNPDSVNKKNETLEENNSIKKQVKSGNGYFEYSDGEYSKPITLYDVELLRSIGRKSINQFQPEDIKKAQKWAFKFYKEFREKSPFFRAWFGDWRSESVSEAEIVKFLYGESPKINYKERIVTNRDMKRKITIDSGTFGDSMHYAKVNGDEKQIRKLLGKIDEILEKAIWLDTRISEKTSQNKKGSTQFMHYLYTPISINGAPFIAKLAVEEYDLTAKQRAYNLQRIEMSKLSRAQYAHLISENKEKYAYSSDSLSIAQLFGFVKEFDKTFNPKAVSKYVLNNDGTPRMFDYTTEDGSSIKVFKNGEGQIKSAETGRDANIGTFDGNNANIHYQKKKTSNHEILSSALESGIDTSTQEGQNELKKLREYQAIVDKIDELEKHLADVKAEIKEITFTKGTDRTKLRELNDEKIRTVNRLNVYDEKLLRFESMKPIKDVIARDSSIKKQTKKPSIGNSVFTEEEMLNIRKDVVTRFNLKGINGFAQVQRNVLNTLKANGFFESNGERKVVIKENGMVVTINRGSIEETFGNGSKYESIPAAFKILKLATIEQIPSIIENATVAVENEKNKYGNGKNKSFTYLSGMATIEGKSVPVRVTLKISKEKNKFWVHYVDVIKNADDTFGLGAKNASPTDSKVSSAESSITQPEPIVKKQLKKTSNREILANALDTMVQNDIERKKLEQYKKNIALMDAEEKKLTDLNAKIKELSFAKGARDIQKIKELKSEAIKTTNRINTYDRTLLNLEGTAALKGVLEREKQKAYKRAEEKGREALDAYRDKMIKTQKELISHYQESRKNASDRRKASNVREKIKHFKETLENSLLHPTENKYIPQKLVKAMIAICELIDTDTSLYKADGSINKAQVKRNETKEKLRDLLDEYQRLKTDSDPAIKDEYDEAIDNYLAELRDKYADKSLSEMSLEELEKMYSTLKSIRETLNDAKKIIGEAEAKSIYEAGDEIVAEQNKILEARNKRGKVKKAYNKAAEYLANKSLSPIRLVLKMTGYNEDSALYKLFKSFEHGVRQKNMFIMRAYKFFERLMNGKEYESAIYDVHGKEYVDRDGRKFGISKMQKMQAIMSYEREQANNKHHIEKGGLTFANLELLNKGRVKDAVDKSNSHQVTSEVALEMIREFQAELADDSWAQEFMAAAHEFFDEMAKDAVNETTLVLNHRIIATDKSYIPFEVDSSYIVREISSEYDLQQTINSYGMLQETQNNASQPLIMTGLNNILDRHIEQVGNIYGLAIPVRNFNKVWNVNSLVADRESKTVKGIVEENWGTEGVAVIEQTVKDLQGPRKTNRSRVYQKAKQGYIGATFLLNYSVVMKQVGSLFSASAMLSRGNPIKMFADLVKTIVNYKKISAEVDQYTASAWMRRQGMSDAEVHTLTTQAKHGKLTRLIDKLPAGLNPAKVISAMDSAVALTLWEYAKSETQRKTSLDGEALMKATAEFYDDLIESTQSMTDVLHRPEIQKSDNVISDAFGMFKTDLYQMAGQLNVALGKCTANNTKENRKDLLRVVRSVAMSAVWGQLMTSLFALLRYRVDQYRDDEDDELTVESWLKRQGFALAGDMLGYVLPLFGSEFIGAFETVAYGETTDETVDSLALDAINDLLSAILTTASSIKEGEAPSMDEAVDLIVKSLQIVGIPANNIKRTIEAFKLHIEDIQNGEFLSFNAGIDISASKYAVRIAGATTSTAKNVFEDAIEDLALRRAGDDEVSDDDRAIARSNIKTAIGKQYKNGDIRRSEVERILGNVFGEDEYDVYWTIDKWDYAKKNGNTDGYEKYGEFYSAVKTGKNLKAAIKRYTEHGVDEETLARQITNYFKPIYKEMSKAERAGIKGYLLNAYVLLGYDRIEKSKDISAWLKD